MCAADLDAQFVGCSVDLANIHSSDLVAVARRAFGLLLGVTGRARPALFIAVKWFALLESHDDLEAMATTVALVFVDGPVRLAHGVLRSNRVLLALGTRDRIERQR